MGLLYKSGGSYKTLHQRIKEDNLNVDHIEKAKSQFRGFSKEIPIKEILVKDSSFSGDLKNRVVKTGLLEDRCSKCGIGNIWCGEPISLQLDHINGDHCDNRIENLRILCPNCHSQTKTFGRRNKPKQYRESDFCKCGAKKCRKSKTCNECRIVAEKIDWPARAKLESMLWQVPTSIIAKELGVSDKAVEKHARKLGLTKPPRGYWTKRGAVSQCRPGD